VLISAAPSSRTAAAEKSNIQKSPALESSKEQMIRMLAAASIFRTALNLFFQSNSSAHQKHSFCII
jgi:hypothetical protein